MSTCATEKSVDLEHGKSLVKYFQEGDLGGGTSFRPSKIISLWKGGHPAVELGRKKKW